MVWKEKKLKQCIQIVAEEAPMQTSESPSVTVEVHAIQSLHDTRPERFSD